MFRPILKSSLKSRIIRLTWFDDLEIDVPEAAAAAEEMAGCENIMSDLIGGNLLIYKIMQLDEVFRPILKSSLNRRIIRLTWFDDLEMAST